MANLLGLALAGGKSSRMGVDKALLRIPASGETFIEHAFNVISSLVAHCFVSCGPDRRYGDFPVILDKYPGLGPASGIMAGLAYADAHGFDGCLVLACDLPRMTPEPLAALLALELPFTPLAALYKPEQEGKLEMLAGIYYVPLLARLKRELPDGERSLYRLAAPENCYLLRLPKCWQPQFANCNSPDDYKKMLEQ